jgi:hypothetical protein
MSTEQGKHGYMPTRTEVFRHYILPNFLRDVKQTLSQTDTGSRFLIVAGAVAQALVSPVQAAAESYNLTRIGPVLVDAGVIQDNGSEGLTFLDFHLGERDDGKGVDLLTTICGKGTLRIVVAQTEPTLRAGILASKEHTLVDDCKTLPADIQLDEGPLFDGTSGQVNEIFINVTNPEQSCEDRFQGMVGYRVQATPSTRSLYAQNIGITDIDPIQSPRDSSVALNIRNC